MNPSTFLPQDSFAPPQSVRDFIPPLENGDRLTRMEFERRYLAMPRLKKAELIEGEVHMPSPVRLIQHGKPQSQMVGLFAIYSAWTPGVHSGDNTSVRLDTDNEPQPDGLLLIDPDRGGRAKIDKEGYIEGAPELVAEIASSTASMDLGKKRVVYRRNQVLEYVVWRVLDRALDWFCLRDEVYDRLPPDPSGIFKSPVFPGLWIDSFALLAGDYQKTIQTLQEGLQSPEHQAFVTALTTKEAKKG